MKNIPTEADLEQIKAALTAVKGVTDVRVMVMVHTDVEDEAARERVYDAEAALMGTVALRDHAFGFRTHCVGVVSDDEPRKPPEVETVADLQHLSDDVKYARVLEDGYTYAHSKRGEANGWSKIVPA